MPELQANGLLAAPPVPLNLIGDYGGGAMMLVAGLLAALVRARGTGKGQVVETSIAEGALALTPLFYGLLAGGRWGLERGANLLDGGAPFYRCYECADGRYVAVGPIEPKFYQALVIGLGLEGTLDLAKQYDRSNWPETAATIGAAFGTQPRDHWAAHFAGSDACVTPVLDWSEAPEHPQHQARGSFASPDGVTQPTPQVGFSETPAAIGGPAPALGADNATILGRLGFDPAAVARLTRS